jgi:hypothetical protein
LTHKDEGSSLGIGILDCLLPTAFCLLLFVPVNRAAQAVFE